MNHSNQASLSEGETGRNHGGDPQAEGHHPQTGGPNPRARKENRRTAPNALLDDGGHWRQAAEPGQQQQQPP